jgi:hypothetical protein
MLSVVKLNALYAECHNSVHYECHQSFCHYDECSSAVFYIAIFDLKLAKRPTIVTVIVLTLVAWAVQQQIDPYCCYPNQGTKVSTPTAAVAGVLNEQQV